MQNIEHPKRVSIVLPVKNGMNYMQGALISILQNIGDCDELIIVDDASTDGTLGFVRGFAAEAAIAVRIIESNGIGPAGARNLGIMASVGNYVAFIDHDDYWPEHRINDHVAILESNQSVSVVIGKTQYVQQGAALQSLYHVHLGASTFRRSVFEAVGVFNPCLNFSEDHDLFLRIREVGLAIMPTDDISLYYRVHSDGMTNGKSLHEMQLFKVILDSIRRRRLKMVTLSKFPGNINRT